jgi:hypothetical protein
LDTEKLSGAVVAPLGESTGRDTFLFRIGAKMKFESVPPGFCRALPPIGPDLTRFGVGIGSIRRERGGRRQRESTLDAMEQLPALGNRPCRSRGATDG